MGCDIFGIQFITWQSDPDLTPQGKLEGGEEPFCITITIVGVIDDIPYSINIHHSILTPNLVLRTERISRHHKMCFSQYSRSLPSRKSRLLKCRRRSETYNLRNIGRQRTNDLFPMPIGTDDKHAYAIVKPLLPV